MNIDLMTSQRSAYTSAACVERLTQSKSTLSHG